MFSADVKFEVVLQKQFLSVVANHSNSDFATLVARKIIVRLAHTRRLVPGTTLF